MRLEDAVRPIGLALKNLLTRATVSRVDDSEGTQLLQVQALADETIDRVQHFLPYGFTSSPLVGSECVLLAIGAHRESLIALGVGARSARMCRLADGEVAVYDRHGSTIVLRANGDIEITPGSGRVTLKGDLGVSGTVSAGEVTASGVSLTKHAHGVVGSAAGEAVVFVPNGRTGGPA